MVNGRIDKYQFEEGYCQAEKDSYYTSRDNFTFCYYDQDHLGNIREVVDASGNVKQITQYYPFGATYADASATKNPDLQQYKYNGKELDRMHGLNTYDYGARQHDPILGRWDRIDPLCEKYYSTSPYVYCGNNPVNAIDPDGNLTVFINGFRTNPLGSLEGYWKGHDAYFDKCFKQDHRKAEYRDGSFGGWASWFTIAYSGETHFSSATRYQHGYEQGQKDAMTLLMNLERNSDGKIIEPLILATHSMGGQYGKGYAQAIMEFYNKNKEMFQGFNMYEFDFAPFQADKQKAVKGVTTIQIHDKSDLIATPTPIEGAKVYFVNSNLTPCAVPHFIDNTLFWNQVKDLAEGSYKVVDGNIVRQ